jgi:hypothetical protein
MVDPVLRTLTGMEFRFARRRSKELRRQIVAQLKSMGWSGAVRLAAETGITVTSMHRSVALCLQTGSMSRFYADMLKLQYLFVEGKASAAIYVIPSKRRAAEMGSNRANFERFVQELELFEQIITVPCVVIGLDWEAEPMRTEDMPYR